MTVKFHAMAGSALLIAMVGISAAIEKCAVWKEIAPCTCKKDTSTYITCSGRSSYEEIVDKLEGHFAQDRNVILNINNSSLDDLNFGTFRDLNMTIGNLKLNHNSIGMPLNPDSFDGLRDVRYLSLSDNNLDVVPEQIWGKMPSVATVDLGRSKIQYLRSSNFKNLPALEKLIIPGNLISWVDKDTFPKQLNQLHLGRNLIRHLNDTLIHLSNLNWLFVNDNKLDTLDGQLPLTALKLNMIHAADNNLAKLPQELNSFPNLESLFLKNNKITSMDGAVSKCRKLVRLNLEQNHINTICKKDFEETENLQIIILRQNALTTLNNSLGNLRSLKFLDVSYNYLNEFSLQDLVGLQQLKNIDLSHNQISKLVGPAANLVEWNIKLQEIKLDHNLLETLYGALSGLPHLENLNVSFNKLKVITPDDLIGLDKLEILDLSHNELITLEEMSKTFLPKLSELRATHNYLTILEKDFHGLPVLCYADFEQNQIIALGRDLVAKTRCQITSSTEGTWDTLKINLQDNPILCDAALPEITNLMEVNHTKISGVTKTCLPLREQPVTKKPNAFLGYIPEPTSTIAPVISAPYVPETHNDPVNFLSIINNPEASNNLPYVPTIQGVLTNNEQYTVDTDSQPTPSNHLAPLALQNIDNSLIPTNQSEIALSNIKLADVPTISNENNPIEQPPPELDPIHIRDELKADEKKIAELQAKIKQLTLEEIVLSQRLNKTLSMQTTEPPTGTMEGTRTA